MNQDVKVHQVWKKEHQTCAVIIVALLHLTDNYSVFCEFNVQTSIYAVKSQTE